LIASVTK